MQKKLLMRAGTVLKKVQMANKHTKSSTKEMQIKMILKFYLTPVRMATIKKTNKNKCGQGLW
jgi:hypothetical protein